MALHKVCIIGANGQLGGTILAALVDAGGFQVSALRRATSAAPLSKSVTDLTISPTMELDELVTAFDGQDAVIVAIRATDASLHERFIEAASRAGVRRFIPGDFGSFDSASPMGQELLQLCKTKVALQKKCQDLASLSSGADGFSWTALVTGHLFDEGLRDGLLHVDLDAKTMDILDSGVYQASLSTMGRIGEGVVRVLQKPSETRNKKLFIQSARASQLDLFNALEKVSGTKWTRRDLNSGEYLQSLKQGVEKGDKKAFEDTVFVLGTIDADWTKRDNFANGLLGLADESVEDVVSRVLAEKSRHQS